MPAIYLLGVWFVMQFVNGVGSLASSTQGPAAGGVAFWAHIAGFGVGAVLVFVFRRPERQDVAWWDTTGRPGPRP
jgi:membrane associated rhomboid family serine protease